MIIYNKADDFFSSNEHGEHELPPIYNDDPSGTVISLIVMSVSMGITVLLLIIIALILLNIRDDDEEEEEETEEGNVQEDGNMLERQPLLESTEDNDTDSNRYGVFSVFKLFGRSNGKRITKNKSKSRRMTQEEEASVICNNFIIEKGFVGSNIFPNYNVLNNKDYTLEKYLKNMNIDLKNDKQARESYSNILLKELSEEELENFEKTLYSTGTSVDIETYNRSKKFQELNPPFIKKFNTMNNLKLRQRIQYRGLQSYQFLPSCNEKLDSDGNNFLPSFIVNDKLNVAFTNDNESSSTIMNLPMPKNNKDCSYFECKIYMNEPLNDGNSFSIGLVTIPYPYYRLPGYNSISIAYESCGNLRINNCVTEGVLPKLHNGDVVGLGYRYKSGLIFITYNGKKALDIPNKHSIELFVSCGLIGPNNSLNLQFNIGQIGYLFIEANVRKYAFDTNIEGTVGVPPSYQNKEKDKLILKSGYFDIQNDTEKNQSLPPEYEFTK
ncbi:hypothetical protein ACO0SA_002323 [Hanseniaspora valbyensis]